MYMYTFTCIIHTYMHACRQTDRQTGRQADRQTGRQAGRQTDIHTYILVHIHMYVCIYIHNTFMLMYILVPNAKGCHRVLNTAQ